MSENTLAIAFNGQLYPNKFTPGNYVYPESNKDWVPNLFADPRIKLKQLGINGNHFCFSIIVTSESVIYAITEFLPSRAGGDSATIMLRAGGPTKNGKQLIEVMQNLLNHVLQQSSYQLVDENTLKKELLDFKDSIYWDRKPNNKKQNETIVTNSGDAQSKVCHKGIFSTKPDEGGKQGVDIDKEGYRIYKTEEELHKILEQPYQPAYKGYKCIHVIPKEAEAKPKNIELIDKQLETVYFFKFPDKDVKENDGKMHVSGKEQFTLIYSKEGYNDYSKNNLSALSPDSDFFEIEEDIIKVKSAKDIKHKFSRTITISAKNESGNPVEFEFQIKKKGDNNWIKIDKQNPTLKSKDGRVNVPLEDDVKYEYRITADGYEDKEDEIEIKPSQKPFPVTLTPKKCETAVCLIPSFSKSKKQPEKTTLSCTETNEFYSKYLKNRDKYNTCIPTFYVWKRKPKVILIIACIISLIVGCSLGAGFGYLKGGKSIEPFEKVIDSAGGNKEPFEKTLSEEILSGTNYETHDVTYLNSNDIWVRDSLQSIRYQYFFDTVLNNKIKFKDVSWDDYNEVTNDKWMTIYNAIQKGVANNSDWSEYRKLQFSSPEYRKKAIESDRKINLDTATAAQTKTKSDVPFIALSPH